MAKRNAKSPVRWFGGKHRAAPSIVELLPEHKIYVEVFGGGGSVLFCKEPSPVEVYNDLNDGLTNLFDVIRDEARCAVLLKRLAATPYSRAQYYQYRQSWRDEADPIERARQWFVVARSSFGAMFGSSWSFGLMGRSCSMQISSWLNAQHLLLQAQARLALVQIEQRDFRDIIRLYDSPDTVFYLDPPYVESTRRNGRYEYELTDDDHRDLVDLILGMQGHAVLSGYPNELYKPLEKAGFSRLDKEQYCSIGRNTRASGKRGPGALKGAERTECIWHKAA